MRCKPLSKPFLERHMRTLTTRCNHDRSSSPRRRQPRPIRTSPGRNTPGLRAGENPDDVRMRVIGAKSLRVAGAASRVHYLVGVHNICEISSGSGYKSTRSVRSIFPSSIRQPLTFLRRRDLKHRHGPSRPRYADSRPARQPRRPTRSGLADASSFLAR